MLGIALFIIGFILCIGSGEQEPILLILIQGVVGIIFMLSSLAFIPKEEEKGL